MNNSEATEVLNRQCDAISPLKKNKHDRSLSPEFIKWQRNTEVAIKKIFGERCDHLDDFTNITYYGMGIDESVEYNYYVRGLDTANAILQSMIEEIDKYGLDVDKPVKSNAIEIVEKVCLGFHRCVRQLQSRRDNRTTLEINDEYDVQDLFHAILRLHFEDIRAEEYVPSYAGANSRVDFMLKREKIVIEIKKTRANLKEKEVGEQLLVDIGRYQEHPDCKQLFCFVYDPEGKIGNPSGIESDLEKNSSQELGIRVIIAPKF